MSKGVYSALLDLVTQSSNKSHAVHINMKIVRFRAFSFRLCFALGISAFAPTHI